MKLILPHQSFSQLLRGEFDLTCMIFQAQSRMMFGLEGEDADILAHELASLTYDPWKIKDEIYARRQPTEGHRIVELSSWSDAQARSEQWCRDFGHDWSSCHSWTLLLRVPAISSWALRWQGEAGIVFDPDLGLGRS